MRSSPRPGRLPSDTVRRCANATGLAFLLLLAAAAAIPAAGAPKGPGAAEILRRAEDVRSPDLDYAVDFEISVLDNYTPGLARRASYTMIAHGKDQTAVLMLTPEAFYGGTLMISGGAYWLLLPKATKALQLSAEQVLRGDIANGDLARANLLGEYEARIDGEEEVGKERCWRLDLVRKADSSAHFSRIRCWIAKKGFLPRKFEYYGLTGAYLKTALYSDYRKTSLGLRPMRLEIDNPGEMQRKTTMVFSDLRKVDAAAVEFTPEGMVALRDAAVSKQKASGVPARPEDLLAALAAAKS